MTLGALIVLAGLVVAGIYVPRISKTHANAPDANSMEQTADSTTPSAMPSEAAAQPARACGRPSCWRDECGFVATARRTHSHHRFRGQLECDAIGTTRNAGGPRDAESGQSNPPRPNPAIPMPRK